MVVEVWCRSMISLKREGWLALFLFNLFKVYHFYILKLFQTAINCLVFGSHQPPAPIQNLKNLIFFGQKISFNNCRNAVIKTDTFFSMQPFRTVHFPIQHLTNFLLYVRCSQAFIQALLSTAVFPQRFSFFSVCLAQWFRGLAPWQALKGKCLKFRSADSQKMHFYACL